jgi:hypothetical protein
MEKYEKLYISIEPELFRMKPHLIIKKFSPTGEEVKIKDVWGDYAELGKILLDFSNHSVDECVRTADISDEELIKYLEGKLGKEEKDKFFVMCSHLLYRAGWQLETGMGVGLAKTCHYKRLIKE